MKNVLTCICAIVIFAGCNDSDSHTELSSDNEDTVLTLSSGESIVVHEGDKLLPQSEETYLRVVHNVNENTKSVSILSGSATLVKAQRL